VTTIRQMIEGLTEGAAMLAEGMDANFRFAICNGADLQFVESVDVDHWQLVTDDGSPGGWFLLMRAHVHPGERLGELAVGASADLDQELRDLTDGPGSA
jgi:hypothetical protein